MLHIQGWEARIRQSPLSQAPGMAGSALFPRASQLLWIKASSRKLSLGSPARGTAWTQRESFHILLGA